MSQELAISIVKAAETMEQNDHLYEIVTIRTNNNGNSYYAPDSHGHNMYEQHFESVFNRLLRLGYQLMPEPDARQLLSGLNSDARDPRASCNTTMYVCVMKRAIRIDQSPAL
jgi:hypothetical protein